MTNKEVIDVLEDMKVKIAFPRSAKTQLARINEALEIAIKKLKTNDRNEIKTKSGLGYEEYEKLKESCKMITDGIPATNGDVIEAMFPHAEIRYYMFCVEVKLGYRGQYDTGLLFDKEWWNAPYKGGE
jgi:hypothetical protein